MIAPAQSKSSLETLADCAYKYGQVYLLGKRSPQSDPAIAGVKVHKLLEDWRNTGVLPTSGDTWQEYAIGDIALEMIKLLPPFGTPGIITEQDCTFELHGYKFRAIKDWVQAEPLTLGDYKTTSNIDGKHVLSSDTFLDDIQAVLSGYHMVESDVWLDWTYGQTKGPPAAKKVRLRVLKQDLKEAFYQVVEPLTIRALGVHSNNDPESLPKNFKACTKYGWVNRCHMYDHCHPKQRSAFMGASLLEQLRQANAINPPVPPQDEAQSLGPTFVQEELPIPKRPRGRPRKETPVPAKPIRTLFVDCMPLTGKVTHAHTLIARAAEQVCADLQVPNIKLIDFGKGGGCLAAQLENDIRGMEPGFDLVLQARTVEGRDVYQTLLTLADNVVIGL